jgi:ParB family chromosome partitioning protein
LDLADFRLIELTRIVEDPEQPRRALDEAGLAGLADSIRQHGVLNPITVAPLGGVDGFRIVTGERRWRAAQIAGLYDIPCIIRAAPAAQTADKTTEQLIENLQREELTPLDKARALRALKEQLGATNREVAQRLGISERSVGYLLDLLDLPEGIGEQIVSSPNRPADGSLTEKHGRALRQLGDQPDLQQHLVEKIRDEKLSGEDTNKVARALRSHPDKQDEILGSAIEDLPRVLGREEGTPFSAGGAFVDILQRMLPALGEVKISAVSAGDLPALQEALEAVRATADALLAEVRAAARQEP